MRKLKLEELGRDSLDAYKEKSKIPLVIVLDNIRSAMNVGSVFRTSDAYLIEEIVLCGITARPPHKEILKTAIGATQSVNWSYSSSVKDTVLKLKSEGYQIVGIEQTDNCTQLAEWKLDQDKKFAVIFGNEVEGISTKALQELDLAVELEQHGTKHSLNVSVCAGIVIWHAFHQLHR